MILIYIKSFEGIFKSFLKGINNSFGKKLKL